MTSHFPSTETLRWALTLAVRAPSVHNSQPWLWRVGRRRIHLHANPDLALPGTDPDARDLILSCGASLNHAQIALAALGWQAKIHRFPDPATPGHLAEIELRRYPPAHTDTVLAAAISRRRTDRRNYSSRQVSAAAIAMMGARAARAGVMLRRFDALTTLRRRVMDAEARHHSDPEYVAELAVWSGRYDSTAGIPARSTPRPDPGAVIPARAFAGAALEQPADSEPSQDNAAVIALGTVADDRLSQLRAGEATSLVLLTATAAGLASCPITGPLEFPDIRAAVGRDVFGSGGHTQMLLRIGWAPESAEPLPVTPRRPLDQVVAVDGDRGVDEHPGVRRRR
ncbi:MAG: nitroreductase family protein [Mycobacterium kyogaense]|uniref:Acg family FMN-binding oxidoreductase n=1 Tax=Mycobacterium kyogaense TaxID=2212479 RepID=UPI002FF81C67